MSVQAAEFEELLEQGQSCDWTAYDEDEFFAYVAGRIDGTRDQYEAARADKRLLDEDGGQDHFAYVKPYVREQDVPLEEDWRAIEDAYYTMKATPYEDVWDDIGGDLIELGGGFLATAVMAGITALTGSAEAGMGTVATGSGTTYRAARLRNSTAWEDLSRAIRYHWEDGEAPPKEDEVQRFGEIGADLEIRRIDEAVRDGGGLASLPGTDLTEDDVADLLEASADEVPDGCELRAVVYHEVLGQPQ